MAETVLSIAGSLMESATSKVASLAVQELSLLMGVETEIWSINYELKTMQAFLRAVERTKDRDELLKLWAEQVEDLSYDIEYCIDEFKVSAGHRSFLQKLTKIRDRHQIAVQIRNLKAKVEEVSTRNQRYIHLMKLLPSSSMDEGDSCKEESSNQSAFNIYDGLLVGFSTSKHELTRLIDANSMSGTAQVVCVVGVAGLGKTTLARKVYASILDRFSCCAWIFVSQTFDRMELLTIMIREFLGGEALKKQLQGKVVREDDLASYLREELNDKRYLLVIDDLWNKDDWNWIKSVAFPSNNNRASRIIVTTQDVDIAENCTSDYSGSVIYHHRPLETNDAIELLLMKSGKSGEDIKNNENMQNIFTKMVKKTGHIPLAILTIGGVLATTKESEWEEILNSTSFELESGLSRKALQRVLTFSYSHLPSHLKPCFLYLSIFPKYFEIERRRLINRWIAGGFVTPREGMNIEDVAKSYFDELINRSMIQPSRVNIAGEVMSCRVQTVLGDLIFAFSRDQKFLYLVGDNAASAPNDNFRHIAYHGNKFPKISMNWSHARSFSMFCQRPLVPTLSLCSPHLRMLSALDLQDAQFSISQKDFNNIGLLRHLKYLNVRGCSNIYALPQSVGKLHGLQTLDMRNSYITMLPTAVSKLHSLHSLRCSKRAILVEGEVDGLKDCMIGAFCPPMVYTQLVNPFDRAMVVAELSEACSRCWSNVEGVSVPKGINNLKELEILEVVDIKRTNIKAIKELGELVQLRKLSVITKGAAKGKCKVLGANIEKFQDLRCLRVDAGGSWHTLRWLDSISSPSPLLKSLKLSGFLGETPNWFGNLMQLTKIYLWGSQLKEGKSMEILGSLPNLMLLRLYWNAYVGEKLVFKAGAFPNIRKIDIYNLEQLSEMKFEDDSLPLMDTIEISFCSMYLGIIGIRHLPHLREISLKDSGKVRKLGVLQSEMDTHPNSPKLRLENSRRHHDLGDAQGSDIHVEAMESHPQHPGECSQLSSYSKDHGLGGIEGSHEDNDDDEFCSCISDEENDC